MKEITRLDLLDISQGQDRRLERWLWACSHSLQPQISPGSYPVTEPDMLCVPVFCVPISLIHLKQLSNLHRTLCTMPKAFFS